MGIVAGRIRRIIERPVFLVYQQVPFVVVPVPYDGEILVACQPHV